LQIAIVILTLSLQVGKSSAIFSCTSSSDCIKRFQSAGDSVCIDGECTNPFERGCLQAMDKIYKKEELKTYDYRVCNSNDIKSGSEWCLAADIAYDEVRIAPSNWESSIVNSWIMQIILSEMLHVPTVIENGDGVNGPGSFYDNTSKVIFVDSTYESNIHETLVEADRVGGNCIDTIEPCAHVLPEVWEGGIANSQDAISMFSLLLFLSVLYFHFIHLFYQVRDKCLKVVQMECLL